MEKKAEKITRWWCHSDVIVVIFSALTTLVVTVFQTALLWCLLWVSQQHSSHLSNMTRSESARTKCESWDISEHTHMAPPFCCLSPGLRRHGDGLTCRVTKIAPGPYYRTLCTRCVFYAGILPPTKICCVVIWLYMNV